MEIKGFVYLRKLKCCFKYNICRPAKNRVHRNMQLYAHF
jgi:hypothetical protein